MKSVALYQLPLSQLSQAYAKSSLLVDNSDIPITIFALTLHFLSNLCFVFKQSSLLPGDLSSMQLLELVYSIELSNFRFLSLPAVILQNT